VELPSSTTAKGFLGSLYDFGFTNLVASKVIRFVYALSVVLYSIGAAVVIIASFRQGAAGLVALIVVPIGYLISLIWLRIVMEFFIVVFRMGDDIHSMRLAPESPNRGQLVQGQAVLGQPVQEQPAKAATTPPAGWYDAPGDQSRLRYWDGAAWTAQFSPKPAVSGQAAGGA
jgi:hypothetical protein